MRSPRITLAVLVIAALAGAAATAWSSARIGRGRTARPAGVQRVAVAENDRRIDVNSLSMYVTNTGSWAYDQIHSNASGGLNYPKGTIKTVLYAGGIWLGCTVGDTVRTVIGEYGQEFGPGPILPGGEFADPASPIHKIYKVVRFTGNPADTDHVERPDALLATDPTLDPIVHHSWSEYVANAKPYGAPTRIYRLPVTETADLTDSVDVEGPDVTGDQMLWCVYNDLNPDFHTEDAGSTEPLGVEVQQTAFAFNRQGALGNTLFMRFVIINKGVRRLDNLYVSLWADPDLGGAADDLVGSDVPRSLGYCYNATNDDQIYGTSPPALGYDFFLGPRDTTGAILGLTSFNKYINGTDPHSPDEAYDYMRGLLPGGEPLVDPTTDEVTTYFHPGDPVTGTGWLDNNPADRRFLMNSGPFRMAPGDTQVVVGAIIVGQGSDRLSSITGLRFFDDGAQQAFDLGFDLPSPPPQPKVSVDLDHGQVTLCWDAQSRLQYFEPGYAFEGYNVYQGATLAGPWKRLATFDEVNGIGVVRDTVFDTNTGQLISDFPVAFGGDNGIHFCYSTRQDAIRGGDLRDGTEYFFAVTSYSVGLAEKPRVLENAQEVVRVVPQRPPSGTDKSTASVVEVVHSRIDSTKAPATNQIQVSVVDPAAVRGHCYRVTFTDLAPPFPLYPPFPAGAGDTVRSAWNLIDVTSGQTLLQNQLNVTGNDDYRVFDGLLIKVVGAYRPTFQDAVYENLNGAHARALEGVNGGLAFFNSGAGSGKSFLGSTLDPAAQPDSFTTVEIRFSDTVTQKAYRYFRFEQASDGAGARRYLYGGFHTVPFTVWDAANNVQLDAAFVERMVTDDSGVPLATQPATQDSTWGPDESDDGAREYLFVFRRPYSDTPKDALRADGQLNGGFPVLFGLWSKKRAASSVIDPGDRFSFVWANPATSNDVYDFCTTPLERNNATLAKNALDRIRVVPNPYYAHSRYEVNQFNRVIRFINLPEQATVRIFNLGGDLVRTLRKTDPTTSVLSWDVQTERALPVGSGIYIYHVDVPGVGSTFGRMVVFMEKERLNNF